MKKKLVIVTGATRGVGLSITRKLLENGYQVGAIGRKLTPELESLGRNHKEHKQMVFYPYDLSRLDGLHSLVTTISSQLGRAYGLINNAAMGVDGVLATMHESDITEMVNVNLVSAILMTKYVSRGMLMNGRGRIINISSIIASTGFNGLSVYAATKAGLLGMTRSLARELGRAKITVNAIAPGYMETDMTASIDADMLGTIKRRSPLSVLVRPDDIANAVLFLLGADAQRITGATMTIDAGSTA